MKIILRIALVALIAHFSALYFPWWAFAVGAFLVGAIIEGKNFPVFASGFVAVFFLWGIKSFLISSQTDAILDEKMAELLGLPNHQLLVFITAIIGGLVGGFSTLTGLRFRRMFKRERRRRQLYR